MKQQDRYWQAKKTTLLGAMINAFLGVVKVIGGIMFHSHSLFADGIHSFSDLITDMMIVFAAKYGSQDADDTHPYGHQRIETAATLMLALLLILAGLGIAWDSLLDLIHADIHKTEWFALPIVLLSIAANESLFHYTYHVGKKIQSALIVANAWHHRSDAASSAVVALGILGNLFGFLYLDAIAAIVVGFMIIKMGFAYGWNSVKELVDTAVEPKLLQQIEKIIQTVHGVERIHQLRSRSMGTDILIDVHILVSPYISVSEGHYIAQHVHQTLIHQLPAVKDVTVHVDPEDDEICCPSMHLPCRDSVDKELLASWQEAFPGMTNWTLHYLNGKLMIDLYYLKAFREWQALSQRIQEDLQAHPSIQRVCLLSEQGVIVHGQA